MALRYVPYNPSSHEPFHSPLPRSFPCPTSVLELHRPGSFPISFKSLIDDGSHAVLIVVVFPRLKLQNLQ
jgi:hypothetical protein